MLIATTYLVFRGLVGWLGLRLGYLGGFRRGVYVSLFPGRIAAGWLYPALMFAPVASVADQRARLGWRTDAAAGGLGLLYGWTAYRTGTIRYTIPAHFLVNAMGLQFAFLLLGR